MVKNVDILTDAVRYQIWITVLLQYAVSDVIK